MRAHHLIAASMTGAVDACMVCYKLSVVFVGCQHIRLHADGISLFCQSSDDIIGLVAIYLQDGDAIGLEQFLDDRHCLSDVLRCLLSLGFISRESLAAEGRSVGIEGYADVGRLLFGEYFVQGIEEPHDGTRIQPLRVDTWVLNKCIIAAINERISV